MRVRQTGKPSKVTTTSHIWATHNLSTYPQGNGYSGKWLIYADITVIDQLWERVRAAILQGLLGKEAKVSTVKLAGTYTSKKHLICVYTHDYRDKEDVFRIRKALYNIGVIQQISYKSSEDYQHWEKHGFGTPLPFPQSYLIKYTS